MGQVSSPSSTGWASLSVNRLYSPGAGAGASGNNVQMIGNGAGLNSSGSRLVAIGVNALANAASSDLIAIGDNAGAGGIGAAPDAAGTILIGSRAGFAITTVKSTTSGPMILIGRNVLQTTTGGAGGNVMIGDNIAAAMLGNVAQGGATRNVMIGINIATTVVGNPAGPWQFNMFIGAGIANSAQATVGQVQTCIMIGDRAGQFLDGVNSADSIVAIGTNAFGSNLGAGAPTSGVYLGHFCGSGMITSPSANVMIGSSTGTVAKISATRNVIVGSGIGDSGTADNTVIGAVSTFVAGASAGNVIIGSQAGQGEAANQSSIFLIETFDNVTQRTILYGNMGAGSLVVGNSRQGTNRDVGAGTNILKLINGTSAGALNGGGYFYALLGNVRWVTSGGVETQLNVATAGQIAATTVGAYTNNAAAAAGTLANAPVVGNPTKWIPINDNGTIRNIPAW